ncbi:hypothetical protein [Paracoccus aminophilus]|uniref:hypothetical protein n=1 Tax=Paracoccus aminophilus TaxID=34003 RepID=UPI000402F3F4|nr:hypothetical protein [Paracoccus aminophilus]
MAKAIFHGEFHYSSRIRNAGWSVYPSPEPQYFPRELIDAAVAAGRATEVLPNASSSASRSSTGNKKAE